MLHRFPAAAYGTAASGGCCWPRSPWRWALSWSDGSASEFRNLPATLGLGYQSLGMRHRASLVERLPVPSGGSNSHPVVRRLSRTCCGRRYSDPVMATGWHMVLGSLPLLAVSAAREGPELATHLSQLNGEPANLWCCGRVSAQHVRARGTGQIDRLWNGMLVLHVHQVAAWQLCQ